MQYGVSTWLWISPFSSSSIELFSKIQEMGFTHVEIPVEDPDLIDGPLVKKALNDNQLLPIVCGAFGPTRDLTHWDRTIHQNCFDYLWKCFELCHQLDASFVAGPIYSAVGKARLLSEEDRRKEWDLAVKNLTLVCERAGNESLQIAIEPINRFETDLVNNAADVLRLVQDISHPAAKILLDSFHMTLEELNLEQAIKLVGEHLIHLQVSENYRGTPGTGLTDWLSIKEGLDAIQYNGVISIESFTPNVQELAEAVCIWKPFEESQDKFAADGLKFLQSVFG